MKTSPCHIGNIHSLLLLLVAVTTVKIVKCWTSPVSSFMHSRFGLHARRRDNYVDDEYYETNDYWDEEPDYNDRRPRQRDWQNENGKSVDKPGPYNLYFSGTEYDESDAITWELCDDGSTWVLLPPPYVETPTAVIHFVGGTFFGSSPKLWYRTLLEGIVRATQCTMVATPIPVTLLTNPLRHVSLSRKLQRQFQAAYMNVLGDEYDADALAQVPLVGMGHSLGARLLTVLATLSEKPSIMVPPYKAYILMSVNNFGASASVPGIQSLLKQSKSLGTGETTAARRPARRKRQRQTQRDYLDDDDFYDEDDEDWDEIMDELQGALLQQADRVKEALTPRSEELEFHPTPDQLWEALKADKRYRIPQTLVVHFEDDKVDQSPRLADCLVQTETSSVKYAWLRGNHLTPISAEGEQGWSQWLKFPSNASKALLRIVNGSSTKKRGPSNAMRDLRQSIARYITDVVTK